MPYDTASKLELDTYFDRCPLVNRPICDGECYDVQMVRGRFMNESVLGFELDRDRADKLCHNCPFNQLNTSSAKELTKVQVD